jgi:ABC-type uncharacterized transport system auxiliary subunit
MGGREDVSVRRARVLACLVLGLGGCLFPKPPPPPRYFTPTAAPPESMRPPVAVRLGLVRSPLHLRESITWRRADEYGFYEQRRWAELPATYVERALARDLYASDHPYVGIPDAAPLVTVELRQFEEVLAPVHEARVALAVQMADARCVRIRETFTAARPLDGDDPGALARGIGEALDEVTRAVGSAVRQAAAGRSGCRA